MSEPMTETENDAASPTRRERVKEEMRKYLMISAYLWVCFAALSLFKAAVLEEEGFVWTPLGFAIVQALVLGKFILIGDALKAGHRDEAHPLFHRVAWRTLGTLGILVVFKALEELIVGFVHGKNFGEILEHVSAQPLWVHFAPVFLMLLILIPMITGSEIHRTVGAERFRALLFGR